MKITHNKVGQNLNLSDANRSDKAEKMDSSKLNNKVNPASLFQSEASQSAAQVSLSERAMDAKKIKDIAMSVPDIDQAKVEKFRKLIDDGNYKVDSKAVAEKMVDEHLMSEF
ncbi:MAG: flagellar biosynthesis anti-sigma factor FlgM [Pseudobdellovibrionaceae bacterium]